MADQEPQPRLAALRYRDYRLLWSGQFFSTLGKRMQTAVILWQVYELTGEELALGLVGLVNLIPIIAISLMAGMMADRFDRRRLMWLTHVVMAVLSALLAFFTWQGNVTIGLIYAISFLSSAGWTFETPARQAFLPSLVPAKHLANAYSLMSAGFQMGSIIGPAIAGLIIARLGVAAAHGVYALFFFLVIITLMIMKTHALPLGERPDFSLAALKEGLRFVFRHPIIRPIMFLDFFATFFSSAIFLLPVVASDILMVGADGYGLLYAAVSIGAVMTAALLSLRPDVRRQGQTLLWAIALYGAATVVFGLSRSFVLSFIALAVTGVADTLSTVVRQTVRNLQTPDRLRGRMTSLNMIFFRGGPELGELEAGLVASVLGVPFAVVSGGLACLAAVATIAWRSPQLRSLTSSHPPDELTATAD